MDKWNKSVEVESNFYNWSGEPKVTPAQKKTGKSNFDIKTWAEEMFPFGAPTKEELDKMWDLQKSGSKNMVDNINYWKS